MASPSDGGGVRVWPLAVRDAAVVKADELSAGSVREEASSSSSATAGAAS